MKLRDKSHKRECRSRNGCLTCRRRRVKCDEIHPKCSNCTRLKLDCSYGVKLLWENDAKNKGISFGRSKEGRTMKRSSIVKLESFSELAKKNSKWVQIRNQCTIFLNTTFNEFENPIKVSADNKSLDKKTNRNSQNSSLFDIFSGFVLTTTYLELEIFNYGINKIFPMCICFPGVNWTNVEAGSMFNPYLNLVAPLAMKSNILYKSILSVSLKQLYLLGNTNFDDLAIRYSQEVLTLLPQLIRKKKKKKHTDWDDVLGTILMLCFADISSDCDSSWIVHLNGAKEFLRDSNSQLRSTPLFRFFSRYFITHEIMGQTAWIRTSIISDDTYFEEFKCDDSNQIDLVLGCSPQLISVVNNISNLGEIYEKLEKGKDFRSNEREILKERDNIEEILEGLEQNFNTPFIDIDSEVNIIKISEIKRLTSLVYLYARIDLENAYQNGKRVINQIQQKYKRVKIITKNIIDLIESLPSVFMSLLWTLFVIGVISVETDEERYFVLSKLIDMERIRGLASVKMARRVVESVWKEKDLHIFVPRWKNLILDKANTISLA